MLLIEIDIQPCYCAVTHQPQSSGGQRASLRIWMSGQEGFINPPHNYIGQLMALLEQLYNIELALILYLVNKKDDSKKQHIKKY